MPIVHKPLPKDDPKRRRPDITRAKEVLGWEPAIPFDEGMRRTIAWFREQVRGRDGRAASGGTDGERSGARRHREERTWRSGS